ncbi:MAG: amylo-alpha-1,6-glucosidase [Phycisphaerae bacterium]
MHRDSKDLRDPDRALATEWLLTDGTGGYASSTVLACPARRYHGLWVPALRPPVDRRVILAHVEELLKTESGETYLSTCEYADGFYPDGFRTARAFDLEPFPRLVSRAGDITVERDVLLLRGGKGVCLTYCVTAEMEWALELAPFLALRSVHHLARRHDNFRVEPLADACGFCCLSEGMPGVSLWTDARADVRVNPAWYEGVLRRTERERGFDCTEDLLMPGRWTITGSGRAEWHVFCSFDPPRPIDVAAEKAREQARRADLIARVGSPKDERLRRLVLAADAFLVDRRDAGNDLATIIAGYHWFGDWGRDAMIALPGLALETGRLDVARRVLEAFSAASSDGLIPNRFAEETGQAEYNTVDASLWFLQAVAAYVKAGGDMGLVRERLWPVAIQIIQGYRNGTRFGIRADADGLIAAGNEETQLTWMDARRAGRAVTPRCGKAVEVNALWISGLALMDELAPALGADLPPAADLPRLRRAFADLFWNDRAGCLHDCIRPDGTPDASLRPNQILAVGLPHAPLAGERARRVVRVVRERLLTPRGLRSLAPDDSSYCGTYAGGPDERDGAYHQGTAWPWLLGPYVDAIFEVEDFEGARGEATGLLERLLDSMDEAGLGQIGEIFDGDPPHRPRGCIAQAWSVAAAIHIWRRLEATGG